MNKSKSIRSIQIQEKAFYSNVWSEVSKVFSLSVQSLFRHTWEHIAPPLNSYHMLSLQGVIDYIFFSKTHMSVLGLMGPLDSQWLVDNSITGCPHPHIPSDHFSLLAQLELHPPLHHPLTPLNGLHLPVHR